MYKFTVTTIASTITAIIDTNDPDETASVSYSEVPNPVLGDDSHVEKLKAMVRSNGGLFMGIDPEKTTPRDLRYAFSTTYKPQSFMLPFELAVEGAFPPINPIPEGHVR
jgi:hypothetical protein